MPPRPSIGDGEAELVGDRPGVVDPLDADDPVPFADEVECFGQPPGSSTVAGSVGIGSKVGGRHRPMCTTSMWNLALLWPVPRETSRLFRMAEGEWSLAAVHDVVAAAVPDREMLVCGDVRRTFGEVAGADAGRWPRSWWARASGCAASAPSWSGGSAGRTRSRWCCTTAPSTSRRCSAATGPGRSRSTSTSTTGPPRWAPCSTMSAPGRSSTTAARAAARRRASTRRPGPHRRRRRLRGRARCRAARAYEHGGGHAGRRAAAGPSPDDLYLVCTGGTTGRPKAVLWRQADIYVSAMAGAEGATAESIAARRDRRRWRPWYAAPPLMHAAAQWTAFSRPPHGGTTVLCTTTPALRRRPRSSGSTERERVDHDVDRRRRLRPAAGRGAAQRRPYDLSLARPDRHRRRGDRRAPRRRCSSCCPTSRSSTATARRRPAAWPSGPGTQVGAAPRASGPAPGATVLSRRPRRGSSSRATTRSGGRPGGAGCRSATSAIRKPPRPRSRSSTASGWPSPATGPSCSADGSIRMLGRDSMVVNTGGEKVFVEEVEAVLLTPSRRRRRARGRPARRSASARRSSPWSQLRAGADARSGRRSASSSPPRSPASRRPAPSPSCDTHPAPRQRQGRLPVGQRDGPHRHRRHRSVVSPVSRCGPCRARRRRSAPGGGRRPG